MAAVPQHRILLVDDDPDVVELIRLALPEYEIGVVGDAEGTLQMAEAFQPHLFIIDLILPGMRGSTLALLLRDTASFAKTPIFLLSGLIESPTNDGEPVRVNGFTGFGKPFNVGALQRYVRLHIEDPAGGEAATQELQRGRITGE